MKREREMEISVCNCSRAEPARVSDGRSRGLDIRLDVERVSHVQSECVGPFVSSG